MREQINLSEGNADFFVCHYAVQRIQSTSHMHAHRSLFVLADHIARVCCCCESIQVQTHAVLMWNVL